MERFKKRLTKSLIENGNLIPSTIEEIKIYLEENQLQSLPPQFELNIDSTSKRALYKNNHFTNVYSDSEENLAQAAREGKEIPDEIKRKMKNDRESSDPKK